MHHEAWYGGSFYHSKPILTIFTIYNHILPYITIKLPYIIPYITILLPENYHINSHILPQKYHIYIYIITIRIPYIFPYIFPYILPYIYIFPYILPYILSCIPVYYLFFSGGISLIHFHIHSLAMTLSLTCSIARPVSRLLRARSKSTPLVCSKLPGRPCVYDMYIYIYYTWHI